MYFGAGTLDAPGAMFTASHNPAGYNGIKLCLAGARPVGVDTGSGRCPAGRAEQVLDGAAIAPASKCGNRTEQDLLAKFVEHVISFIDPTDIGQMKVVADTANGMGGLVVPAVMERLPASSSRSCTPNSTARSRTTLPTRCSRPTSAIFELASWRAGSTSDWPSTAMPTASSSSTNSATA